MSLAFVVTYMPVDGATFFAVHEHLSPSPLRVWVEGHPSYEECPLRQLHANPLPSVGSDGTFLACPPGSLVVSRGLIGGVALASTDTTIGGVLHWFALGHMGCSVLGRGAEPPQFWVLLIFLCLPAYVQPKKAAENFFVTKFYEKWYTYVFERAERDGNVRF